MEGREGSGFDNALMKKPRSSTARRPRPESNPAMDQRDTSSSSSMSSRSNLKRLPSDDNVDSDGGFRRREFYLNTPSAEHVSKRMTEGILSLPNLRSSHKTKGSNQLHSEVSGSSSRKNESSHGIHVSAGNQDSSTSDKPRKVKLKIGGISHNIPAKPYPDMPNSRSSPAKPPRPGDSRYQQKHGNQTEGTKDSTRLPSSQDKKTKKERAIEDTLTPEQQAKIQREPSSDPVRKSRRLAKKSILDSELDEDYDTSILENLGISDDAEGHIREPKNRRSSSKKNASKKAKKMARKG